MTERESDAAPTAPASAESARLSTGRAVIHVRAIGAAIASITLQPIGHPPLEVLARTPWADAPPEPWRLSASADEWHRTYPGGWHVLLPRALGPAVVDGVEQPFHGEAAWRRWHLVRESENRCTATVSLRTLPLRLERTYILDETSGAVRLTLEQRIVNLGSSDLRIGWVEHPAFTGDLFTESDVTLNGAPNPIGPPGTSSFSDDESLTGDLRIDHRPTGTRIELTWDPDLFPRTYLWQERRSSAGFPWHRQVDAVGIEPATQRHDIPSDMLGDLLLGAGVAIDSRLILSATFDAV